jgi:hypothetical protein
MSCSPRLAFRVFMDGLSVASKPRACVTMESAA